jgi:capsular polysaccharide transport system permease protein
MKLVLALTPRRLKIVVIALPLALAAIYLFFFAVDRYVSESIVSVRQANQDAGSVPGIALLLGAVNPPAREDTLYLRQYIQSLELLNRLEARLKLREHFQSQRRDPFFRLRTDVDQETFLDFYRSRVEVVFDDTASLLTVRVQGFDPEYAQRLNAAILEESERFVNTFSQRMAREQMSFSQAEVDRSWKRMQDEKGKLLAFQTKNKLLDPGMQAQASSSLTADLQANLARQEAELRAAQSYLNDDSYPIKALRSQIDATRAQLDIERLRATAGTSNLRLNALTADFQELMAQASFAQDTYKLALAALENARIDASRKVKSLIVIEPPSKPETARYPRRIYNLLTLLIISTLLYGIVRLVLATVREHID